MRYIGLGDAPPTIQKISEKNDMWVVSRGKKNYLGYDAFVELMRSSFYGRVFASFLSIKISRFIGRKIYRFISGKRKLCTLPRPVQPAGDHRIWKIVGGVICVISLYSMLAINIAVMNCGKEW